MFNLHIDSKSVGNFENWVAKKNFVSQNYVGYKVNGLIIQDSFSKFLFNFYLFCIDPRIN